jgi:hypothetical protein
MTSWPVTARRLTRCAPLVFLAHDLEEALQTDRMSELAHEVGPRLPAPIRMRVRQLHYRRDALVAFAAQIPRHRHVAGEHALRPVASLATRRMRRPS